ncbi:transcriptional regulator, GntR family [Lachnospiraceae bacterium KM106-2]|nr:transcriptional regulator, GntR family [Lachnospiraceae bacterium KM106-2]
MKKEKQSLKSIVYQETLDGIIRGEYKAGQIINEQELVQKFGYSKSPIREALIALCNDEILRSIPRYGYEIIRFTNEEANEIMDFRFILESSLLKECYQNITEPDLAKLYELDEQCNQSVDTIWEHWEYNTTFHLTLVSLSKNKYAYRQLEKSMDILKRAYAQFYWDKWDSHYNPSDMRYHASILSCIKEQDIEGALNYLKLDLQDFRSI